MKIHIVQKGETLFEIAKQYDVDFEELVKVNSQLANPDSIVPGMKLRIPSASKQIKETIDRKDRTNEKTKENKSRLQEGVTKRPIGESIVADDHMKRKEKMDTYPRKLRPFHPNQFMMNEYTMNPEVRPIGFQIQEPIHSQHEVNGKPHNQAIDHPRCSHCHRQMDMEQPTYYEATDKQQPNSNGIPFLPNRMQVNPIKTFKLNNN